MTALNSVVTKPWITENDLRHQRAADHGTDRQRQTGHLRQHGIAKYVTDDLSVLDAHETGVFYIIRIQFINGHGAHADCLAADRDQHDRPEWQLIVNDHGPQKLPGKVGIRSNPYPPEVGNHLNPTAKTTIKMTAMPNAGKLLIKILTGMRTLSKPLLR